MGRKMNTREILINGKTQLIVYYSSNIERGYVPLKYFFESFVGDYSKFYRMISKTSIDLCGIERAVLERHQHAYEEQFCKVYDISHIPSGLKFCPIPSVIAICNHMKGKRKHLIKICDEIIQKMQGLVTDTGEDDLVKNITQLFDTKYFGEQQSKYLLSDEFKTYQQAYLSEYKADGRTRLKDAIEQFKKTETPIMYENLREKVRRELKKDPEMESKAIAYIVEKRKFTVYKNAKYTLPKKKRKT